MIKKKIFAIISALFLISTLLFGNGGLNIFERSSTVFAIGDLTVDWGIGTGNVGPIFNISGFAPGQSEDRDFLIINGSSSSRPVGIKAVRTGGLGNLESQLNIVISDGLTDIYGGASPTGPKTVEDFFSDSSGANFIDLITLAPSLSETFNINVTFDENAGNEFQNTSVIFNLIIGIAIDAPAECANINLSSNTIFGTSGNDRINGTTGNDLIFALEGNDIVYGKGGDDCIIGGAGNDLLRGETGKDVILGEEGNDNLIGAVGVDLIVGSSGNDVIRGEDGNDNLTGGDGNDTIFGGSGNDQIDGGNSNDDIHGDDGMDTISGGDGTDAILGGAGADNLTGGLGPLDLTNGQAGKDTCTAEKEVSCEI
jgi:Ca2+-binding RTX toxin-like protein